VRKSVHVVGKVPVDYTNARLRVVFAWTVQWITTWIPSLLTTGSTYEHMTRKNWRMSNVITVVLPIIKEDKWLFS
jgi:hypothetical protein